jgi:hypothetical protein
VRVETPDHSHLDAAEDAVTSTEDTSPDHSRSGQDIAEAIEVAERGSSVEEVHDQGTEAKSGEAPGRATAGDPEMTEAGVYGQRRGRTGGTAAPGTTSRPDRGELRRTSVAGAPLDEIACGRHPGGPEPPELKAGRHRLPDPRTAVT